MGLDLSALTLNPKEVENFQEFIIERTFKRPELNSLHRVYTGVANDEQIVLASQLPSVGLKSNTNCGRKKSGAKSTLTEKFWELQGIEDTLIFCGAEINANFKAFYGKIKAYTERYDITGSDTLTFLTLLFEEAINRTIYRAAWLGDKSVAAATSSVAGLIDSDNKKFYDYFNGIWTQIFAGVSNSKIEKIDITENAAVTPAAQKTLANGAAVAYFEAVLAAADSRLVADSNSQFYVTNGLWQNYRQHLQSKGENFTIQYTTDGFQTLDWNGKKVVNMVNVFEADLSADFIDNTTNKALFAPNRIVFSSPDNLPIGTSNDKDFSLIESLYDPFGREHYLGFGFNLDAKVLEEKMIVVAY